MKRTLCIMCVLSIFIMTKVHSQHLSGEAIYQTQRHVDIKMDSSSVDNEMQKMIQEQMRRQFQKEYKLIFNNIESLWKEEASLGKPQAPSSSVIQIVTTGNDNVLYQNIKEERSVNQSGLMGKLFLISDTLNKPEWTLEKETKNIGQYKCFKATLTEEYESSSFATGDEEATIDKKTKTTTAWYTLDIPVQLGPSIFWGLPGLILEINDGTQAMMCTKVTLSAGEKVNIPIPTKGKKVSGSEFSIISEQKSKEMMERYQNNGSKKGEKNSFSITIKS